MPDVDVLVIADVVAFDGRVDDGILLKRHDGGADEEGHEGESRSVALLEPGLELVAQVDDAGQVHFEHAVNVRAGAARLDHALGDDLTHVRHGNKIARIRRRMLPGAARARRLRAEQEREWREPVAKIPGSR